MGERRSRGIDDAQSRKPGGICCWSASGAWEADAPVSALTQSPAYQTSVEPSYLPPPLPPPPPPPPHPPEKNEAKECDVDAKDIQDEEAHDIWAEMETEETRPLPSDPEEP